MNDEMMINGIKNADPSAINHAINQYSKLMWHIAAKVLRNVASPEDIEECVADVFVYLWKNHQSYDTSRGSLKVWLSVVAKSKAIDQYRKLSKTKAVPFQEAQLIQAAGAAYDALSFESRQELLAAINALGDPDREIIIRRFYYGQKPKEIAFTLDLPVKQIENRIYRAKGKMRSLLAHEKGEY